MNITKLVKNQNAHFDFVRDGNLWYKTDSGFSFPIPFEDVGSANFNSTEKAIFLMRWIRKQVNVIKNQ